jgi:acyl-coenzyme A thioesterase PaaI-like protein
MPGCEEVEDGAFKGWLRWPAAKEPSFHDAIGSFQWERCSSNSARCRVETGARQSNGSGALHGGFISACIDMALFAAAEPVLAAPAVTSHLSIDFLGRGVPGEPLDLEAELVSDRNRHLLIRVLVRQGASLVASATGSLRRTG